MLSPLWYLLAYLLGAIPFGLLFSQLISGVDPRTAGSKNTGFTNVLRVSTRLAALLTLIADIGKGALVVWLARDVLQASLPFQLGVGVTAVIGHIFSPFLAFKGGKGVATGFGVVLTIFPLIGISACIIWVIIVWASSYVSLGSLIAFGLLPLMVWAGTKEESLVAISGVLTALIVIRHRENIVRLLAGVENRIGTRENGQN